jgi:hypothetical protein
MREITMKKANKIVSRDFPEFRKMLDQINIATRLDIEQHGIALASTDEAQKYVKRYPELAILAAGILDHCTKTAGVNMKKLHEIGCINDNDGQAALVEAIIMIGKWREGSIK